MNNMLGCKYCGNLPKILPSGRKSRLCSSTECWQKSNSAKAHYTGQKRPDHGAKVSAKLKGVPKSEEHKRNMPVNSDNYKKKMLENKNIEYTEDNFMELWRSLLSDIKKGRSYKETCVSNKFDIDATLLSDMQLDEKYREYNSLKSSEAMMNNPNMGKGIRSILIDLKSCKNTDNITVRSTFEKNFVVDFLERYSIPYEYEAETMKLNDGSRYIVDFKIELDGKLAYVEIKGTNYIERIPKTILACEHINKTADYYFVQTGSFQHMTLDQFRTYKKEKLVIEDFENVYDRSEKKDD